MDHGKRFMMNEGLLFLSYAYALSGYSLAAAGCGIACAALAILWHSMNSALNNLHRILLRFGIQLPFLFLSGYSGDIGTIVLLAFCNTIVSLLWMESSFKALRQGMRILSFAYPLFLLGALAMPERVSVFLFGTAMEPVSGVLFVSLLFLPVLLAYVEKTTARTRSAQGREMRKRDVVGRQAYNNVRI